MFGKLDDVNKLNSTGTGLGLYICKQLISFLGPNSGIMINTQENKGT